MGRKGISKPKPQQTKAQPVSSGKASASPAIVQPVDKKPGRPTKSSKTAPASGQKKIYQQG